MKTIKSVGCSITFSLLVVSLALASLPASAQFSQVISVGDSLSDTGNTSDVTLGFVPPSPNFFGRFSNGQVWNELLAIELGLTPPTPSRDGGNNYAYGGALASQDVQVVVIPFILTITLPAATSQLFDYLGDVGNVADGDALYTLSIGGNDILEAGEALSVGASNAEIDAAKQEMRNIAGSMQVAVQQLLDSLPAPGAGQQAGQGRIVLMNVPNVGITPRAISDGKQALFQALSIAFNEGLSTMVSALDDPRILLIDFFALTNDAVTNPANYGLTNVTDRCWSESANSVCANPDEYLFWDDIHPTTMGHTFLMLEVLDRLFPEPEPINVPVPWVYAWLLLAMAGWVVRRSLSNRL